MVVNGYKNCAIRTENTDDLVLAIAHFFILSTVGIDTIFIAFGTGKNCRFIPVHVIAEAIGMEKALALPEFHTFIGCDSVPSLTGKSKKMNLAWKTWMLLKEATTVFSFILHHKVQFVTKL